MGVPVKSFRLGPAQAWSVAGGGGFHPLTTPGMARERLRCQLRIAEIWKVP